MDKYNGWDSYNHWNTALWLNNDERFYNKLCNKVEMALYHVCSRTQAIHELLRDLPLATPDGENWNADVVEELFDEMYNEQLEYT